VLVEAAGLLFERGDGCHLRGGVRCVAPGDARRSGELQRRAKAQHARQGCRTVTTSFQFQFQVMGDPPPC
jgi:hypothetical protein